MARPSPEARKWSLLRALDGARAMIELEVEAPAPRAARDAWRPIEDHELPFLRELGARLTVLRAETVMSREELARNAGLGRHTIRHIERGERRTRPETLRRIVGALGFTGSDVDRLVAELVALAGPAIGKPRYDPGDGMVNKCPHGGN